MTAGHAQSSQYNQTPRHLFYGRGTGRAGGISLLEIESLPTVAGTMEGGLKIAQSSLRTTHSSVCVYVNILLLQKQKEKEHRKNGEERGKVLGQSGGDIRGNKWKEHREIGWRRTKQRRRRWDRSGEMGIQCCRRGREIQRNLEQRDRERKWIRRWKGLKGRGWECGRWVVGCNGKEKKGWRGRENSSGKRASWVEQWECIAALIRVARWEMTICL